MASSFEKSVKGATKVKLAAPKAKYVEHILIATHAGEAGIAEVFRAISMRLRDSGWTIVFKSLIVVHYMIREGEKELTLRYLRRNPKMIDLRHYSDGLMQGRNIRNYSHYLTERARAYGDVRTDYVRTGEGRLRKLTVEKGLLREVECVQTQIRSLLKCTFLDLEIDNEITLLAFRLLVSDLLVLFHVVNEGVITVLEHYFEMSKYDAERALEIYKVFTRQTENVVEYLQQARRVEPSTRLQIPNIKHAPTSLTSSLEEYLNDPDFDINRRQYLAAQEAKRTGGKAPAMPAAKTTAVQNDAPKAVQTQAAQPPKVAPDLIDFFESLETEQTPMFAQQTGAPQFQQSPASYAAQMQAPPQQMPPQQMPMQTGYGQPAPFQSGNPYPQPAPPLAPNFTGAGFGGYTPAGQSSISGPPMPAIPQQFAPQINAPPPQQQSPPSTAPALSIPAGGTGGDTNPFRQSMLVTGSMSPPSTASNRLSTNPFARPTTAVSPPSSSPQSPSNSLSRSATNPFARHISPTSTGGGAGLGLSPTPTGGASLGVPGAATNPFRQSIMLQQQAQQQEAVRNGNFSGQTGTLGGWENMPTTEVFPRPGQQQVTGGGQGW